MRCWVGSSEGFILVKTQMEIRRHKDSCAAQGFLCFSDLHLGLMPSRLNRGFMEE